ncbi:hypothetical protein HK097_009153 [Rhizophlyctis rosea]|uniref:Uncharacterized protein n=1 Tax=Rhizophlyctis rosea TaxID=64517 RepID=A0AAD5X0M7_9FUNG|nr:hypothetical protein HK097_009153 [Rhizophlyctis rosea]
MAFSYSLQPYDMTRLNHAEFHQLREFFSRPRTSRRGSTRARNAQTISKSCERISGYLGWLKESGRKKHPSFADFKDVDIFLDKYVDGYLIHIRSLSHGSVANAITAAIDVLKVLQAQSENVFSECNEISRLKNRRNKEQTLAERERQTSVHDDGTTILWEQRLIVDRLWKETDGQPDVSPLLAKEVQRYTALAFYSAVPPSRSKEIRLITDRVLTEAESKKCMQNHIALIHGRHVLVVSDYKNRHSNGLRDAIELPADRDMIVKYIAYLMLPAVRAHINSGKQHGFLFCKRNGDPFENAGEWSMFLASLVNKHTGIPNVSSNALRHAFTTHVESAPDAGDRILLRESTAYAMRHTIRVQQQTYNNASPIERKRKAVEFAGQAFKRIVCANGLPAVESREFTVPIGALVGMRLSTGDPGFGKVIRVEGDDILTLLLVPDVREQEVDGPQRAYVADLSTLMRKASDEIIYPVDGIYNSEKGFYELFTRLDEVDRLLK